MSKESALTLSQQLYVAKKDWAEKDRIASEKEELKKVTLAIIYNRIRGETDMTIKDVENRALSAPEYSEHIKSMVEREKLLT